MATATLTGRTVVPLPRLHTHAQSSHIAQRHCTHTHTRIQWQHCNSVAITQRTSRAKRGKLHLHFTATGSSTGEREAGGRVLPLFVRLIAQLRALPSLLYHFPLCMCVCVCADNLHWAFHFKCLPSFIIRRNCKLPSAAIWPRLARTHTHT